MKFLRYTNLLMLLVVTAYAQDVTVTGNIDQPVKLPNRSPLLRISAAPVKHISLLKITLSNTAREQLEEKAQNTVDTPADAFVKPSTSLTNFQLGMANVPVLDQGSYGACVTFANTAAIDAVLNKGDYISQLCLLQLGRYLEDNGYATSGWEGAWGGSILSRIATFGLVSKTKQMANGCGGLTNYPLSGYGLESTPGHAMSPVDYHLYSEQIGEDGIAWSSVLDMYQVFQDKVDPEQTVMRVKEALQAGDRLTFGVLLPLSNKGVVGAVGSNHATYDSWVLTPEIIEELKLQTELPGHEMIITGYDDTAIAIDDRGREHKGLFSLRNSWGSSLGDRGNFYMSYDYFKTLVLEVQRIRSIAP